MQYCQRMYGNELITFTAFFCGSCLLPHEQFGFEKAEIYYHQGEPVIALKWRLAKCLLKVSSVVTFVQNLLMGKHVEGELHRDNTWAPTFWRYSGPIQISCIQQCGD
jgi:hypothetical protein